MYPTGLTFETSCMGDPWTAEPKLAPISDMPWVQILDTAGFNDVDVTVDFKNIVMTLEELRTIRDVAAIIYVHSGRTAAQYRDTLQYVGGLFTNRIMANNLIIVYTGIKQDMQTVHERAYLYNRSPATSKQGGLASRVRNLGRQTGDAEGGGQELAEQRSAAFVAEQLQKVQREVKELLGLPVSPIAFDIDSKPPVDADEQWGKTLARRADILKAVSKMKRVDVSTLRLAKLPEMVRLDKERSVWLSREADQLQRDIKVSDPFEQMLLRTITELNSDVADCVIDQRSKQTRLQCIDTADREVTGIGPAHHEIVVWSNLVLQAGSTHDMILGSCGYAVEKDWAVDIVHERQRTARSVEVALEPGSIGIGRTGGHVVCFSYRRTVFAEEIPFVRQSLVEVGNRLERKQAEVKVRKAESAALRDQFEQGIQQQLSAINAERARLEDTHLDLDTALHGEYLDLLEDRIKGGSSIPRPSGSMAGLTLEDNSGQAISRVPRRVQQQLTARSSQLAA